VPEEAFLVNLLNKLLNSFDIIYKQFQEEKTVTNPAVTDLLIFEEGVDKDAVRMFINGLPFGLILNKIKTICFTIGIRYFFT